MNVTKSMFGDIFNESNSLGGFMALEQTPAGIHRIFTNERSDLELPAAEDMTTTLNELEKAGYLISRYQNPTTDWTFVHVVQLKELLLQSNKIRGVTTFIAGSMALFAFVISIFVSGSITRPLLRIKKMMIDWTMGARTFEERFDNDEVGAIGETFKRMASENQMLSERLVHSELKEREAELRALQAQIKPHFLYNTLDSIYWMATLQKNHDIAQMAVSLSESFKLSLNKGKELIPVYKELKHIEHYMTIQNIRYNGRFELIEDIDASIKGMEIMKLLLQPLVENAIYHGLEPKVGPGTVRLTGRRDGAFLVFTVEDDGVGLRSREAIEQGYGMRNVRERMKLYYGESSSFRITSEAGRGTRIELRFNPMGKEGRWYAESGGI
ncbi:sensor histidine kinase [Paenibacillus sp. P26]|nr:sensor histidine kinase [Paenibacillus sp. P26]